MFAQFPRAGIGFINVKAQLAIQTLGLHSVRTQPRYSLARCTLLLHEKSAGRRGLVHMHPVESQLLNSLLKEAKVH